jgi:hypothetical protein
MQWQLQRQKKLNQSAATDEFIQKLKINKKKKRIQTR